MIGNCDYRPRVSSVLCMVRLASVLVASFCASNCNGQLTDPRPVRIELFVVSQSDQCQRAEDFLNQLHSSRAGLELSVHDVSQDSAAYDRLRKLAQRFGHEKAGVPTFYLADALIMGFRDAQTTGRRIDDLLTVDAYVRPGCRHCRDAKQFLDGLQQRRPALKLVYHDVLHDAQARAEVARLASRYKVRVASFPCIHVAGRLIVGFQGADTTGRRIEAFFARGPRQQVAQSVQAPRAARLRSQGAMPARLAAGSWGYWQPQQPELEERPVPADAVVDDPTKPRDHSLEDKLPPADDLRIFEPTEFEPTEQEWVTGPQSGSQDIEESIDVPVFGRLRLSELGLPAFTFLIGLVDGFNPCAMWVLVFLLSVLVNVKDRKKIIVIAGTFVVVSGLAYFAFMAAWFNVFQMIGLLRPVQLGLGLVAIFVGIVNVKDFFAFHKGLSLSIPDSARPGIYRRVRQIVSARHLTVALLGAVTLAVVVNIIELLCTAGLPALYAQILSMQGLSPWGNYMYLGLYIVAYMFDDTLLVTIVVVTLSHRKLQEAEGRWLKLLSGSVILLLGVVMVFMPEWLV